MPLTEDVTVRRRVSRQAVATAERREQILDAAVDAFVEHGFNGTSIREVATRSGMSHPGLLHHFPDKPALLEAVLDRHFERATLDVEIDIHDGHAFLRALIALAARDTQNPKDLLMYRMIAAESLAPNHPAHGYMRRWYADVRQSATTALENLETRGHYTADVDIATAATHIAGLRDGLDPQWLLDPDSIDLVNAVRTQLSTYTDLSL